MERDTDHSGRDGQPAARPANLPRLLQRPPSPSGDRQSDTGAASGRRNVAAWRRPDLGWRSRGGMRAVPGQSAQLLLSESRVVRTGCHPQAGNAGAPIATGTLGRAVRTSDRHSSPCVRSRIAPLHDPLSCCRAGPHPFQAAPMSYWTSRARTRRGQRRVQGDADRTLSGDGERVAGSRNLLRADMPQCAAPEGRAQLSVRGPCRAVSS